MRDGGERVLVAGRADAAPEGHLGGAVGTPHRRTHAHPLEHGGHADAGEHRGFHRHDDVAQVQAAVKDIDGGRRVERVGQRPQPGQGVGHVGRAVLAQSHVERVAFDDRAHHEGLDVDDAGFENGIEGRVRDLPLLERPQSGPHNRHALGRQADTNDLDDDRAPRFGILTTKDRAHAAGTDLVQDAEATVGRPGAVEQKAVLGQLLNSWRLG